MSGYPHTRRRYRTPRDSSPLARSAPGSLHRGQVQERRCRRRCEANPPFARWPYDTVDEGFVMPRGSSPKRERQYEHIKESGKKQGMSESRAKEMASRTVNKERARSGESKTSSRSSTQGKSASQRGGQKSGGSSGADERRAVRGSEEAQHRGPLDDDQAAAQESSRPLSPSWSAARDLTGRHRVAGGKGHRLLGGQVVTEAVSRSAPGGRRCRGVAWRSAPVMPNERINLRGDGTLGHFVGG